MKTIHKFLLTSVLAVTLLPSLTVACLEVECEADADCTAPDECNEILGVCESAGEGEGEGEGEEGEGEGDDCNLGGWDDAAGDGTLTASGGELTSDDDNIAGCGECFATFTPCESSDDCTDPTDDPCVGAPGSSPFILAFALSDTTINAVGFFEVEWSEDGGDPLTCTASPAASDGVIVCPICFITPPEDMSAQYDGDDGFSNATCVDTSGA